MTERFVPAAMMCCGVLAMPFAGAEPVEFESGFLPGEVDLSAYERGQTLLPGQYRLDLYVNAEPRGRLDVRIARDPDGGPAQVCITHALLQAAQVDLDHVAPAIVQRLNVPDGCVGVTAINPHARARADLATLRLDLDIAQSILLRLARGSVDPSRWDSGVNAGFADYNLNLFSFDAAGQARQVQGYAGVSMGFNHGDWHWRHQGAWSGSDQDGGRYQHQATYVQRELGEWAAQALLGRTRSQGELLDSVGFSGLQLNSDDRMLPASQRGFAPVVRGMATSNAKVSIRQNGVLLQELLVAPGEFVIDDLYASGFGGDLEVSVLEADGSVRRFSVPYSVTPLALREGARRYSAVLGRVDEAELDDGPLFAQGTWQHGVSNTWTAYTGSTLSQGYYAGLLGTALNSSVGAFGLDLTQARSELARGVQGQRWRLNYAWQLPGTAARLSASSYWHSSAGYHDFRTALLERQSAGRGAAWQPRSGTQLGLGQHLGDDYGHLQVSAVSTRYWQRAGQSLNYTLSYSNRYQHLGYGLALSRERDDQGRADSRLQLTLSLPLGGNRGSLSSSLVRDNQGRSQWQAGYSVGDEQRSLGLNTSAQRDPQGASRSVSGHGTWRAAQGQWSAGLGGGDGASQASVGLRGALVAHGGGVTFAQPLSETFAIVHAPHAAGARIVNGNGARLDARGYGVMPSLMPYGLNRVELDPKGLPQDVELQVSSQHVVPRAGAVALLSYPTLTGRAAMLDVRRKDGTALPFGANVRSADGQPLGLVGQGSRVFARGLAPTGQLTVQWGESAAQQCQFAYQLPDLIADNDYPLLQATCDT
ncbi:fimbria/pilus outer membrane usher protein [Pseudomonas abieticivorans]|uniref:fimbria/pilus outer membrane usher protein n=1 Tax=Pseudomonas abieticivorans TaxID=2931382 RepID=UPI0020BEA0DB|nr:fimbria/pilus outer membrane usher protein [Pseudomonas sp. PIA16]